MATMQVIRFRGPGDYGLESAPRPTLQREDDVLVRVQAAGICGSDLHILDVPPSHPARPGVVLGHELTGEVVDAGDGADRLKPGVRVVIEPNIACLACAYCQRGLTNQCLALSSIGVTRDGGWAEYCLAPARQLHPLPAGMAVELAALAEPLSCVLGATSKVKVQPGEAVVVLGGGPIGLLFLQVFCAAGAREVIVVEPQAGRADSARALGATEVLDPRSQDVREAVLARTAIGADVVVDAVGSQVATALSVLRRGGAAVLFGVNDLAQATLRQFEITRYEYRILGSYIGAFNFPLTLQVLASGAVDAHTMVTHRLGLGDVKAAVGELRAGRAIKALLLPGG